MTEQSPKVQRDDGKDLEDARNLDVHRVSPYLTCSGLPSEKRDFSRCEVRYDPIGLYATSAPFKVEITPAQARSLSILSNQLDMRRFPEELGKRLGLVDMPPELITIFTDKTFVMTDQVHSARYDILAN